MNIFGSIGRFLSVPSDNPALLKAQYRAFSAQMPMMYFILIVNTWAVVWTHLGSAPAWLCLGAPCLLTLMSIQRVLQWWRQRKVEATAEIARRMLIRTNRLSGLITITFTGWALLMFPYGGPYAKAYLAFYMAITVIGCIFCLTHLRSAAIITATVVNGAIVVFFAMSGEPTFVATAVNILLVSIAVVVILLINYRTFTQMVEGQQRTAALSDENLRLASIDSLTGLPNRRAFFARLKASFDLAGSAGGRLAVGVLDLDGFKPVNDLHGHATGDRLLVAVSRRLEDVCAMESIELFRLGGDEFALLASNGVSAEGLLGSGDRICARLREVFALPEASIQISGSLGLAMFPEMAGSAEELFERADYALYQGKREHRARATLFSPANEAEILRDARIEHALQFADLDLELSVVFQPIVDIATGQTVAMEALARWDSPVLGPVSPSLFIPVAERAGSISRLTTPLLRKAMAVAAHWPEGVRLAFNLSPHDFNSPETILTLVKMLEGGQFPARLIDFEITETAFAQDFALVQRATEVLRALGCGISLDDFGTGYSSLSRLHALPLTKLKIDRSFVVDIHLKPASVKIVKSLLALSNDMGLGCVIEGVETPQELAVLQNLGARLVQGYLFSRPLSQADVVGYLARPVVSIAQVA